MTVGVELKALDCAAQHCNNCQMWLPSDRRLPSGLRKANQSQPSPHLKSHLHEMLHTMNLH